MLDKKAQVLYVGKAKNLPNRLKSYTIEKNLPTIKNNRPIKIDKDVKDDYEFSRKTYKDLIYTGTRSMDVLAELARESEHPRAFAQFALTRRGAGRGGVRRARRSTEQHPARLVGRGRG